MKSMKSLGGRSALTRTTEKESRSIHRRFEKLQHRKQVITDANAIE
jgi:hypothetical protein